MTTFDDKEEAFERLNPEPATVHQAARLVRLLQEVRKTTNGMTASLDMVSADGTTLLPIARCRNDEQESVHRVYWLASDALAWAEKLQRNLPEKA